MASTINLDIVSDACKERGWKVLSEEYINLKTEMKFLCPESHIVYATYGKLRNSFVCPICGQNKFSNAMNIVIPQKEKDSFRVLALDQATQISGWSVFDNDRLIKFGKLNIESSLDKVERISMVRAWLINMLEVIRPNIVVFEDIQLQMINETGAKRDIGINTYRALAELLGVLTVTCFEAKVPYKIVHATVWRSKAGVTGKTRIDKKRSAQLIIKKIYDVSVTEDEADAICIGLYGSKFLGKPVEMVHW